MSVIIPHSTRPPKLPRYLDCEEAKRIVDENFTAEERRVWEEWVYCKELSPKELAVHLKKAKGTLDAQFAQLAEKIPVAGTGSNLLKMERLYASMAKASTGDMDF